MSGGAPEGFLDGLAKICAPLAVGLEGLEKAASPLAPALAKGVADLDRIALMLTPAASDDRGRPLVGRPVTKGHEGRSGPETVAEQLARIAPADLATLLAKVAEKDRR